MMQTRRLAPTVALTACVGMMLLATSPAGAQDGEKKKKDPVTPPLFTSEVPLAVTFTANLKRLHDDRDAKSPWRTATMSYAGADGGQVTVPLKVKTHGIWRLKHCDLVPLRLKVSNKEAKHTLFYDLQKPKMTNACRDDDRYEQYALQELQLYRVYQLLTPASHRVRALRVTYTDSASGRPQTTRYAFLLEDPDEMADRLGGKMIRTKGAGASDLDEDQGALVYAFEYFIANTDFSFNGLHNGELVVKADASSHTPIAYDFDFSGAVNASYATVDPKLSVKRVRDRLFRGYCAFGPHYQAAFDLFRQKKSAIYALYRDDVGKLLEPGIVQETLEYFDDFYDAIRTPRDVDRLVDKSCIGPH